MYWFCYICKYKTVVYKNKKIIKRGGGGAGNFMIQYSLTLQFWPLCTALSQHILGYVKFKTHPTWTAVGIYTPAVLKVLTDCIMERMDILMKMLPLACQDGWQSHLRVSQLNCKMQCTMDIQMYISKPNRIQAGMETWKQQMSTQMYTDTWSEADMRHSTAAERLSCSQSHTSQYSSLLRPRLRPRRPTSWMEPHTQAHLKITNLFLASLFYLGFEFFVRNSNMNTVLNWEKKQSATPNFVPTFHCKYFQSKQL
jgi:hypothetical protein